MDHPRACGGCRLRHGIRAFRLDGVEGLRAGLRQDADEIDGDIGPAHRGLDRGRVTQVGLNRVDLPDLAERLEVTGELGPAHRHADAVIAFAQRPHHGAAQKAGPAKNRHQGFQVRCHVRCHSLR